MKLGMPCLYGLVFTGKFNRKPMGFYHEMWGFPVNFPLNQSIDCFMILRNGIMNGKREWKRVNTKRAASNIGDVHKFPT